MAFPSFLPSFLSCSAVCCEWPSLPFLSSFLLVLLSHRLMGLIDCFICLSFVCLYLSLFALRRRLPYSSFLFAGTFVLFEPIPKAVSLDNQMFKSDPGGALKEFSNRIVCGRSARKSFIDTQRIELIRENNISHGGGPQYYCLRK